MENTIKKKPVKVFSCGPVKAAIWSNSRIVDDTIIEVHSIKIGCSYKDGDEWKYTNSLNVEDLPKVVMVANEAYKFIRLRSSEQNDADEIEPGRE